MYAPGIPFFQTTLRVKAVPPAEDGLFPAIAGETGRLRFFPFPPIRDYGAINILNTYPDRMINAVTVPKKIQISFQVITFFRRAASGTESPTVAIMNAIAVPIGTPFATNTWITGTIAAAFAYIGTAQITATGTAHQCSRLMDASKNPSGT